MRVISHALGNIVFFIDNMDMQALLAVAQQVNGGKYTAETSANNGNLHGFIRFSQGHKLMSV